MPPFDGRSHNCAGRHGLPDGLGSPEQPVRPTRGHPDLYGNARGLRFPETQPVGPNMWRLLPLGPIRVFQAELRVVDNTPGNPET
jgi:hypothetical protein